MENQYNLPPEVADPLKKLGDLFHQWAQEGAVITPGVAKRLGRINREITEAISELHRLQKHI